MVTVSQKEMTVSSFIFGVRFDTEKLEVTRILWGKLSFYDSDWEMNDEKSASVAATATEANNNGSAGATFVGSGDVEYFENTALMKIQFKVKEGATGTTTITLFEKSDGANGFTGDAQMLTVNFAGSEPACDHADTTKYSYDPNGNGTHKITCACGEVVNATATCSGGTATCGSWAICATCKATYGELNKENHAPDPKDSYYRNNGKDHTFVCSCGEDLETESHDYATGTSAHTCVCGKVETFKLTIDDMADENKTFEVPYGANILEFIAGKVETGNVAVNTELHKGYLVWTGYWEVVDSEAEEVTKDDVMSGNLEICAPMISIGWERSEADDPWSYFDENGGALIGWNQIDGAWYYFIEDEVDGWHYRAEGLTRVPYPSVEINGVKYAPNQEDIDYFAAKGKEFMDATEAWFYFDENGKFLSTKTGLVDGSYVENGMIAWHYGLVKIGDQLYYFVEDAEKGGNKLADGIVWVTRANGVTGLEKGACYLFEGGKVNTAFTGIEGGKYFENGKYMIGAGLVKVGEDYYYVRSSGQFATGKYYITKTNGIEGFETGKMLPIKNGVVEEGGALYFYQNNHMMCGAGLIEYKGAIYYVRSSGKVATGTYYITNTNGMEGFEENDKLLFGEDGKLIVTAEKNGIVEENGALYYYENGRIAYNAGLIEIDGDIYYVRSNGQVATGVYYVTNTNDMEGFEPGDKLTFGEDGKLTK